MGTAVLNISFRNAYKAMFILLLLSCVNGNETSGTESQNSQPEFAEAGFQKVLRNQGITQDAWFNNDLEVLQVGNIYSNYYYNLTIKFPDHLQIDRGPHEFSIIRASDQDYGLSFSLAVIPTTNNNLQTNPNIDQWRSLLKSSGIDPVNVQTKDLSIGQYTFHGVDYRLHQYFPSGNPYYMRITTLNVLRFNKTYSITYSAPENLFDVNLLTQVLNTLQIINPD